MGKRSKRQEGALLDLYTWLFTRQKLRKLCRQSKIDGPLDGIRAHEAYFQSSSTMAAATMAIDGSLE